MTESKISYSKILSKNNLQTYFTTWDVLSEIPNPRLLSNKGTKVNFAVLEESEKFHKLRNMKGFDHFTDYRVFVALTISEFKSWITQNFLIDLQNIILINILTLVPHLIKDPRLWNR